MPSYDYECKECGYEFEAFQTMSENPLVECPACGEASLRRLIGGGMGIIFKGSGFYVNDSRASNSAGSGKSGNKNGDNSATHQSGEAKQTAGSSSDSSGNGGTSSSNGSGGESSGPKSA